MSVPRKMPGKIKDFLRQIENALSARILLMLGLISLIVAQILFERREPIGGHIVNAVIWNAVHNLEIVNYDNVWRALPFLFGGLLLWFLFGKFQWDMSPQKTVERQRSHSPVSRTVIAQLLLIAALYGYLIFRLTQTSKTFLEPALWIFTLAWLTLLIWDWERKQIDLALDFTAADLTSILILLMIGIVAGAFALTDVPKQIVRDELPFLQASQLIASGGYNASIFEVGVFTFPLFTTIYQSWVMQIFGVSFWSWKFSSVIAGVVTVIPLYLLARNWFDRRVAFASGLVMLVNPYFLSFSRFGYNNIHSLFPITLAVYLWEKGIRKDSIFYLWLGGLAAGLGYYSYFSAWLAAIITGLSIFYIRILRQISWKQAWAYLATLVSAFTLAAAPRVVFAVSSGRNEALTLKVFQASFINAFYGRYFYTDADLTRYYPFVDIAGLKEPVFFNPQIYWELFVRGIIRTFLALVNPYLSTEHFLVSGFAGVVTPVFFMVGLILALKHWTQTRAGLLLLWFFSGMIFLGVLDSFPPRQTHLVAIIPVLAIFSALGLISAVDSLVAQDSPRRIISSLTLLVVVFFSLRSFFVKLPITHPADFESQSAWVARREDVRDAIVYIGPMDGERLVGTLARLKIVQAPYLGVPENVAMRIAHGYVNTSALIFYEGRDENIVREIRSMEFLNFAIYEGGIAFTNADINLTPDDDLYTELILFLKSPALITLGVLLAALCLHFVNERYYIVKLFTTEKEKHKL